MEKINGDKLRGHLETMVLSCLEESESHGVEIIARLDKAGCGLLKLKEGSLYPALYRLEAAGCVVVARLEQPESGRGAKRRIYKITQKGKRQLAKGRLEWTEFVHTLGSIIGAPA